MLILALLAASCAPTRTAQADPPAPGDDAGRLRQCLARAGGNEAALSSCKGEVALACLGEWASATQTLTMCWSGEWNAWHSVMEATLARLEASDSERAAQLRASQQAWSAWVEIECAYRAAGFSGGSGAQPALARCGAGLTADRAISLLLEESAY